MLVILKARLDPVQQPVSFDEHRLGAIDQNVGDRLILEQWFEWPEPEQLIQNFANQRLTLARIEHRLPFLENLMDEILRL